MSNSAGRISAPISLHADVYPVLGVAKTGTYYDIGWVCSNAHGRTNKWSRNKPVRVNTQQALTDAQMKSVNFGLQMPSYYPQDFKGAINNATYTYLPPRPGTDWCRITDFNNYSHIAVSPLRDCVDVAFDTTFTEDTYAVTLNLDHQGHDSYNIGLDEFPGISSMYLACILEYNNGRGQIENLWKTASQTLGNGGFTVTFDNLSGKTMQGTKYYMCASNRVQSTQTGAFSSVDFYGLPFNTPGGASANFRITASQPMLPNLLGATSNPTGSSYTKKEDAVVGGIAYGCNANTGLWMQVEITNRATRYYTMRVHDLTGELRPSWDITASSDYKTSTTGYIQMKVYQLSGSTWSKVDDNGTISFEPGEKLTLRIGHPQWSRYVNGTRGTTVKPNKIVDYCEVNIIDGKSGMMISNPGCRISFI